MNTTSTTTMTTTQQQQQPPDRMARPTETRERKYRDPQRTDLPTEAVKARRTSQPSSNARENYADHEAVPENGGGSGMVWQPPGYHPQRGSPPSVEDGAAPCRPRGTHRIPTQLPRNPSQPEPKR